MSWELNLGPSFNITRTGGSYSTLSGFGQRFMLLQSDQRMTPGKPEPHLPAETMKGTTKTKKANRKPKRIRCKEHMPAGNPEPIYGGFGNITNAASTKVVKRVKKKKKIYKLK